MHKCPPPTSSPLLLRVGGNINFTFLLHTIGGEFNKGPIIYLFIGIIILFLYVNVFITFFFTIIVCFYFPLLHRIVSRSWDCVVSVTVERDRATDCCAVLFVLVVLPARRRTKNNGTTAATMVLEECFYRARCSVCPAAVAVAPTSSCQRGTDNKLWPESFSKVPRRGAFHWTERDEYTE